MEADWEFEVGGDAPVLETQWDGFVDLRLSPQVAGALAEVVAFPALATVLEELNAAASPVWTSKCDFFPALAADEFDARELDAPLGCAAHAVGCYIDVLPRGEQGWAEADAAELACQRICLKLSLVALRCCRVDLIIRRAFAGEEPLGLGVTAYFSACGRDSDEARAVLAEALGVFAEVVCAKSTLQYEDVGE